MTSREIIIDLIDKQIINGQDAFTLINDLLKAELLEAWETLNASKQIGKSNLTDWVSAAPYSSGTTYTTTALSATSGTNVSSI